MSTSILPDDSVVIRLARETIHLNASARAIHVRAAHPRRDLGGSLLASYPLSAAERVRLRPLVDGRVALVLELKGGVKIGLGDAPSQDVAMITARVVADLTRCKVDVSGPETRVKAHLYEPTGRLYWEDGTLPSVESKKSSEAEPDTDPPAGWTPPEPIPQPATPAPRTPAAEFAAAVAPRIVRGEPVRRPATGSSDAGSSGQPSAQVGEAPGRVIRGQPESGPVFADLLRESQMYEPVMPSPMEDPDGADQQATQVGIGGWRGRSSSGTRLRAIFEMLRLTSERMPVATESLAFALR